MKLNHWAHKNRKILLSKKLLTKSLPALAATMVLWAPETAGPWSAVTIRHSSKNLQKYSGNSRWNHSNPKTPPIPLFFFTTSEIRTPAYISSSPRSSVMEVINVAGLRISPTWKQNFKLFKKEKNSVKLIYFTYLSGPSIVHGHRGRWNLWLGNNLTFLNKFLVEFTNPGIFKKNECNTSQKRLKV